MPPNASHQMRNNSDEPRWYATLSSRGGHFRRVNTYQMECSEARPGSMEGYERIMEVRQQNGVPVP